MNLTQWDIHEFPSKTGRMHRIRITPGVAASVSEHYPNSPGSKRTFYIGSHGRKQFFDLTEAKKAALKKALEDLRKEIAMKQKTYKEFKEALCATH